MTQKVPSTMTVEDLTDAEVVHKTGNETIAGDKTFSGTTGFTGTFGYATGAGGTVTQATSKSTGVTLNKACGQITMDGAALAAGAVVSFAFTNSTIDADDLVMVIFYGGGLAVNYNVWASTPTAGACFINLRNITAGSLSNAVELRFTVIKGVSA